MVSGLTVLVKPGACGAWLCAFGDLTGSIASLRPANADARLDKRLRALLEQIGDTVGESVPMACQDWANMCSSRRV